MPNSIAEASVYQTKSEAQAAFIISTSPSPARTSTSWRKESLTWPQFVDRLREPVRTPETIVEYHAMPKDRRTAVKDVGGFVGGVLRGGRRQSSAVVWRTLIVIDIDEADPDFFEAIQSLGIRGVVHSTHSHTPDQPRFRLVLAPSRAVLPDEYRRVVEYEADMIELIWGGRPDKTSVDPSRLMFWPSVCTDGEYLFAEIPGEPLDVDHILGQERGAELAGPLDDGERKRLVKQAGNPFEKPDVIGAFCRTFNIHEAIEEFLSDIYAPGIEGRYTYVPGSTSHGLIVYDDYGPGSFAYSHHATDPVSGKLVNSFDLVRIHKFGKLDEGSKPGTPVNRLPSYSAMTKFAMEQEGVKEEMARAKLAEVAEAFGDESVDWLDELELDGKGRIKPTRENVVMILENDPNLSGRLAYDQFKEAKIVMDDLPWRKLEREGEPWREDNADGPELRTYLEKTYGISHVGAIEDAKAAVSARHAFHPVRDYLRSLAWDGIPRADTLLIDYMGAEDNIYTREAGRKFLASAVARVMEPGCKVDHTLVLIGPQGMKKSSFLRTLAGDEWFNDSPPDIGGLNEKAAFEALRGAWIIEFGELKGMRRADVNALKHFLTKQSDRYRPAWGREIRDFPRQCVFAATTNEWEFLRDSTGDRRFWPIDCDPERIRRSLDELKANRDQIWAEAYIIYKAGEPLYLSEEAKKLAEAVRDEHFEDSPLTGTIQEFLDTLWPEDWKNWTPFARRNWYHGSEFGGRTEQGTVKRNRISTIELWVECLARDRGQFPIANAREIASVLDRLPGWRRVGKQRIPDYGIVRCWERQE